MSGQMVIRQDDQGLVRFNLLDQDGTVLMSSKGFDSLDAARAGADRAVGLITDVEIIDQTQGGGATRADPQLALGNDRRRTPGGAD